jgi:hypothetical protein
MGHEAKSKTYHLGTEKAYHHLNRASDCFNLCLDFRPSDSRAMLARSRILIQLASNYQPPRVATASLKDATSLLRDLITIAPRSLSARETLAQACALLSQTLLEIDDAADDEVKVWEGQIGSLAREALSLLEDVAGDKMDRMRSLRKDTAAVHAYAMAETFLALSTAALTVSSLALDLSTVDSHVELAEQALDQASNMATLASTSGTSSKSKSSSKQPSTSSLITRVQLASGKSSIERLRHTFLLGVELDDNDFRALITDIKIFATECREKAAKYKGSKAAAASTLAWEATKQLGDAKLTYANLMRMVWRRRKQGRRASMGMMHSRKLSRASDGSAEPTIMEEDEGMGTGLGIGQGPMPRTPEMGTRGLPRKTSQLLDALNFRRGSGDIGDSRKSPTSPGQLHSPLRKSSAPLPSRLDDSRRPSASSDGSASKPATPRSALAAIPDDTAVSSFESRPSHSSQTFMPSARRGSWLPTHGESSAQSHRSRNRRLSSLSTSHVAESDNSSAWTRKASIIALATDETAEGLVPSSKLAQNAWELLDSAVKHYKTALSLISNSDLPASYMAQAKTETLYAIAYCSLFMASLAPRLAVAVDKKISLLVTSEVYSTWAAREVGWSFLIEGTKESQLADRRTNSWRADESGKRAVMLLLRTWWFRAVTTENMDVDTKVAAKDAVEVVVRRMKEKEGVKDGDVVRYRTMLVRAEGELDGAEALFWRSVARILRGGGGFVMS